MEYTVKRVMPGQIEVEFSDGSWAAVPVQSNFSLDQIDEEVAKYDPEFFTAASVPLNAVNPLIEAGSKRVSRLADISAPDQSETNILGKITASILLVALYLAENGDPTLRDAIYSQVKPVVEGSDFDLGAILSYVSVEDDDIFNQALEELKNGV
jgi:hypothetical protein